MIAAQLTVSGLTGVLSALRGAGSALSRRIGQIVAEAALRVEGAAKELAPVDTGFHRASIRADLSDVLLRMAAEVVAGASYAAALEYGTRRMRAQPSLLPALESVAPWFYAECKRAVAAGVAR